MVNNKNMFISVLFYSVCLVLSITTLVARANTVIPSARLQNRLIAQALAPRLSYVVIKRYVIKPVFLQGLSYDKGMLYLSTGLYHHSALFAMTFPDLRIKYRYQLHHRYFAEGITRSGGTVYNLNYHSNRLRVLSKKLVLKCMVRLPLKADWGLSHDQHYLIASNGSDQLFYLQKPKQLKQQCSAKKLKLIKKVSVYFFTHDHKKHPLYRLNELSYFDHVIYANIFLSHKIAVINPLTGYVIAWIDIHALQNEEAKEFHQLALLKYTTRHNCVSNGVTVIGKDRLLVGGKCWHHLYQIQLKEKP